MTKSLFCASVATFAMAITVMAAPAFADDCILDYDDNGTADGTNNAETNGEDSSLACGRGATTGTRQFSVAIGSESTVSQDNGVAIGSSASVSSTASNSVALGALSVVTTNDTVSVGNPNINLYRRITNVGWAVDETDAVALGQLNLILDAFEGNPPEEIEFIAIGSGVGPSSSATAGELGTAIGRSASALLGGTALGAGADAGESATAIGRGARASDGSTAVGRAIAEGLNSVVIGRSAVANMQAIGSVVIGADGSDLGFDGAQAWGAAAVAIGADGFAQSDGSIAIGAQSHAILTDGIAIGRNAKAEGESSQAFGRDSNARGENAIAIGTAAGSANSALAIGGDSDPTDNFADNDGAGALAYGLYAMAIGVDTSAAGTSASALGRGASAAGADATAIGFLANASAAEGLALGRRTEASAFRATAIGSTAIASGVQSMAIGRAAQATATDTTAIGTNAAAIGIASTALGSNTSAGGEGSTAVGRTAVTTRSQATAIGYQASVNHLGATAIGANAASSADFQVTLGGDGSSVRVGDIDASTLAQVGPLDIVTVDANGTLGRGSAASAAYVDRLALSFADTMSAHEADITALNTRVSGLEGRVGLVEADIQRLEGGVAMAAAIGSAQILPGKDFSLSVNATAYGGEQGFSGSISGLVRENLAVSAGVAANSGNERVLGQVGFTLGF